MSMTVLSRPQRVQARSDFDAIAAEPEDTASLGPRASLAQVVPSSADSRVGARALAAKPQSFAKAFVPPGFRALDQAAEFQAVTDLDPKGLNHIDEYQKVTLGRGQQTSLADLIQPVPEEEMTIEEASDPNMSHQEFDINLAALGMSVSEDGQLNSSTQLSSEAGILPSLGMLVLSRKKDEKIIIGDSISIMVVEIRGDKVRLGIEAPREVAVHRREVYEAIQRHKEQEASEPADSHSQDTTG